MIQSQGDFKEVVKINHRNNNFLYREKEVYFSTAKIRVSRNKEQRLQYLATLYILVDGSTFNQAAHDEIVEQAGLTAQSGQAAFHYLLNEELVASQHLTGQVSITHQGVKVYEALLHKPESQQQVLGSGSPLNIVTINGRITESQIVLGNQASTLETNLSTTEEDLTKRLRMLKEELAATKIDRDKKTALLSELETIETQLNPIRPKNLISETVRKSLQGLLHRFLDAGLGVLLSSLKSLFRR